MYWLVSIADPLPSRKASLVHGGRIVIIICQVASGVGVGGRCTTYSYLWIISYLDRLPVEPGMKGSEQSLSLLD